jgi:putative MATE family efflux protein
MTRAHPLLTAPIGRALWRLAGPTTVLMLMQIVVAIAETWIIGRLGTDALAGYVLVVPFMVLMFNMANGGMGGSAASALARALGAGRHDDARALVLHAMVVALAFALLFLALAWTVLPSLFAMMGGSGRALEQALTFSNLWFAGALLVWPVAFLSALLRGSGNALTPSRIGLATSIAYIALAAALALGIGGWPGLGLLGVAISGLVTMTASLVLLALAVRRGRMGFMPSLIGVRLRRRLFGELLRIGLLGSGSSITASLTAMLVTGLVGRFGTAALAGYGIGMRLEFMLAPLAFAIGSSLTTLVGVAAGAGDWRRANRAAWIGGLAAFVVIGLGGWTAALVPDTWSRIFASDASVVAASVAILTRVAPFYCLFGLGLTLYFASQGAGRMALPFSASVVRMIVATVGGWLAVTQLGWGLDGVFVAIAASLVAYGCLIAGSLLVRPWRAR